MMPTSFKALTLLTSVLASIVHSAPLSTLEPRAGCYKYIVIDSPGLVDSTTPNADPFIWTNPTCQGIVNALPGGYHYKTQAPHGTSPGALIAADVAAGETEIQAYMTATLATCPATKFVLFSYSFGSIPQGIFWWQAGKPQNRGTAKSGTSEGGGLFNTPIQYQGITADYCLTGDYLCTGKQGTGANYDAHHKYKNSQWQADAIKFAVQRLKSDGIVQSVVGALPAPVTSVLGSVPTGAVQSPVTSLLGGVGTNSVVKGVETGALGVTKSLAGVTKTLAGATKTGTSLPTKV